jgi:cytochrome c553
MRAIKLALPAAILMAGFVFCVTATYGKQEYATKEKQKCTFCHGKVEAKEAMPKNLTDAGKYYAAHNHSLDGYKAPEKK